MAREQLYLGLVTVLSVFLVSTASEAFYIRVHGEPLTALHRLITPWLIPILLLLPTLIFYKKYTHESAMRKYNCLPARLYPHRDPLLGTDWLLTTLASLRKNVLLPDWAQLFKTVGNTFWVHTFGSWVLMTNEPENVKAVLATEFETWPLAGPRLVTMQLMIGEDAIFSANGRAWHDARAMIRPSFVRNQIADLKCFERHVQNFLGCIPKDGSVIDLQTLFYMMTMDSATDFMFGHSTNTLTTPTPEGSAFAQAFEYVLEKGGNRSRLGWISFLIRDPKYDESVKITRRFVDNYVQQTMTEGKVPERKYIFLNELVGSGASPEYIRAQLLSIILGGRDTTASALTSLLWELARRPDVVEKLRREIVELPTDCPDWETMRDMKYLNMVLKESLRLNPPVPTNSRGAAKDTVLPVGGGPDGKSPVFMAKGTTCRWATFSMQRRKDIYGPDADEFRPERWEDLRLSWEYLPFSGGPRICIGQQFALTQISYLVVRLFQTFQAIEARDDRPFLQVVGTSTSLANGCLVSLTPA